ncbi:MAG: nitrogen regulation protein NR(II) [Phycisphaerae bacterium]
MSTTRNDAFFHRLCENIGFILIGVDPDLRVCFWNDHAARQFNTSAEKAMDRSILDFIHESDRQRAEELLRYAVTQGTAGEMETRYLDATGKRTTLVLIISPIIDSHGERIGASASMRDISARKRLSQELARNRRMAALGGMAQGVAHHFNNILGGMLTSIDYVLSSDSPRELRRTLRLLAQAIGRATRITQQLEAFAKSGHEKAEWAELNELVRRFVERLGPRASREKIKLDTHIETISSGDFEAQRLLPVLDSIAQNGFDAMSPGGTLTVRAEKESDHAVIRISDTGCGIPEDMLDRIFEPFFTTKGELAGGASKNAGLGLAAVHGLVSDVGGTIEVISKVGEGTTVQIRLPLSQGGPATIAIPSER